MNNAQNIVQRTESLLLNPCLQLARMLFSGVCVCVCVCVGGGSTEVKPHVGVNVARDAEIDTGVANQAPSYHRISTLVVGW